MDLQGLQSQAVWLRLLGLIIHTDKTESRLIFPLGGDIPRIHSNKQLVLKQLVYIV